MGRRGGCHHVASNPGSFPLQSHSAAPQRRRPIRSLCQHHVGNDQDKRARRRAVWHGSRGRPAGRTGADAAKTTFMITRTKESRHRQPELLRPQDEEGLAEPGEGEHHARATTTSYARPRPLNVCQRWVTASCGALRPCRPAGLRERPPVLWHAEDYQQATTAE